MSHYTHSQFTSTTHIHTIQIKENKQLNIQQKQNYPGSVAFYDTRSGNEVGLFYNGPEHHTSQTTNHHLSIYIQCAYLLASAYDGGTSSLLYTNSLSLSVTTCTIANKIHSKFTTAERVFQNFTSNPIVSYYSIWFRSVNPSIGSSLDLSSCLDLVILPSRLSLEITQLCHPAAV